MSLANGNLDAGIKSAYAFTVIAQDATGNAREQAVSVREPSMSGSSWFQSDIVGFVFIEGNAAVATHAPAGGQPDAFSLRRHRCCTVNVHDGRTT